MPYHFCYMVEVFESIVTVTELLFVLQLQFAVCVFYISTTHCD